MLVGRLRLPLDLYARHKRRRVAAIVQILGEHTDDDKMPSYTLKSKELTEMSLATGLKQVGSYLKDEAKTGRVNLVLRSATPLGMQESSEIHRIGRPTLDTYGRYEPVLTRGVTHDSK